MLSNTTIIPTELYDAWVSVLETQQELRPRAVRNSWYYQAKSLRNLTIHSEEFRRLALSDVRQARSYVRLSKEQYEGLIEMLVNHPIIEFRRPA